MCLRTLFPRRSRLLVTATNRQPVPNTGSHPSLPKTCRLLARPNTRRRLLTDRRLVTGRRLPAFPNMARHPLTNMDRLPALNTGALLAINTGRHVPKNQRLMLRPLLATTDRRGEAPAQRCSVRK
jgi:hypothetical protein